MMKGARLAFGAIELLLAATAVGCGGGPSDRPVVRLVRVNGDGEAASAVAEARADGTQTPLTAIASLIPSPLPPARTSCGALSMRSETVTIAYTNGTSVTFGPKCLPEKIHWLSGLRRTVGSSRYASSIAKRRLRCAEAFGGRRGTGLPSVGMVFARPDLLSCGPVVVLGAFGESDPPCPA
jgi:hypothetical protein